MSEDSHLDVLDADLTAYRASPSAQLLQPLVSRGAEQLRRCLTAAHRDKPSWRIAQHLALAWANRLGVATSPPDLTRAAYYAHVACNLSDEHPLARYVRASIYWERRLAYLVLEDVNNASNELHRLDGPGQRDSLVPQLQSLRVCALAYLGRVSEALQLCEDIHSRGTRPTNDALLQCFISTRPSEPELHHRAAMLSAPASSVFGQRPMGLLERAVRTALLRAIAARARLG